MGDPGICLSPHSSLALQTGVSTPMLYTGAELRSSILYSKHLAHCSVSTVLLEALNTSLFTQMKGMGTTGPVHFLFPLAGMFFPSSPSLPSLLLHAWDQPIRSYLFTRVLSECILRGSRRQLVKWRPQRSKRQAPSHTAVLVCTRAPAVNSCSKNPKHKLRLWSLILCWLCGLLHPPCPLLRSPVPTPIWFF